MKKIIWIIVLISPLSVIASLHHSEHLQSVLWNNSTMAPATATPYHTEDVIESCEDNSYVITASLVSAIVVIASLIVLIEYLRRHTIQADKQEMFQKNIAELRALIQEIRAIMALTISQPTREETTLDFDESACPFLQCCAQLMRSFAHLCPYLQKHKEYYTHVQQQCPFIRIHGAQ